MDNPKEEKKIEEFENINEIEIKENKENINLNEEEDKKENEEEKKHDFENINEVNVIDITQKEENTIELAKKENNEEINENFSLLNDQNEINKNENEIEIVEKRGEINEKGKEKENTCEIKMVENDNKEKELEIKEQNNENLVLKELNEIQDDTNEVKINKENKKEENEINEKSNTKEAENTISIFSLEKEKNINIKEMEKETALEENKDEKNENLMEKEENNLIEEKIDQRNDNNEIIVEEITKNKEEKNIIENKEIKEELFDSKDLDKIAEYNKNNYKDFYFQNHFCDYNTGKEWRAGFINKITDDIIEICDPTGSNSSNDNVTAKNIKITDSRKISYFRKYSSPDITMIKASSKNLSNKLSQFINFHKNFTEYLENCDNFEFYYFLRATVYYALDISMSSSLDNKNIEISFKLILIILNIICDCLKYIKQNFDDFLKFESDIKKTQFNDLILMHKKYAIFSFFDDIYFLLKKIFTDSNQYLEWYKKYKSDIIYFIPSNNNINTNEIKINLYSELFPLYEDQNFGKKEIKLLKKVCMKEAYNVSSNYYTLDKKIKSCIVAYFIDYFNYIGGYDTLFFLLCNIKHIPDNFYTSFSIQYLLIDILLTSKTLTNNFSFCDTKKNIINYIDTYLYQINIDEKNQDFFNNELEKLMKKLLTIIIKDEDEEILLRERFYIKQIFKKLKTTKKLEKSISYLSKINNIIKSAEYNSLFNEIKEKNNNEYNEEMLKDKKFEGKDNNVTKITVKYFCELCKDNNILELFLENKTTHEELIKRLLPLITIMYLNNFGYQDDGNKNTQEKKIDSKYIFQALFIKLKEAEQNNESLWKIIMQEILLKFVETIKKEDKIFIFELIEKYYESSTIKKSSRIIQLIDFIIEFSLKCYQENEVKDDVKDILLYNKNEISGTFDIYIKGKFDYNKFFCLDLLVNYLVKNDKINELQVNDDLKKTVINKCMDGIIKIVKKTKNNEFLKKILFIKVIEAIALATNTIFNISFIRKIIDLKLNNDANNEIIIYCNSKKIMFGLLKEFFAYLESIPDVNDKYKEEIEKRLDLIFLLLKNGINMSNENYIFLFSIKKYNQSIKEIVYKKLSENILKIGTVFQKYIVDNILMKEEKYDDYISYNLLKQFILQINKTEKKFFFILDEKEKLDEKYLIIKTLKNCEDIYGYNYLWNILLLTENKEIKKDVSGFLTYIYLGVKYNSLKEYNQFWKVIFQKIIDLFSKYMNNKQNNNKIKIKGLVFLIKKIVDESNYNGDIIKDKNILNKLNEQFIPKNKGDNKDNKNNKENNNNKDNKDKAEKKEINSIKINLNFPVYENTMKTDENFQFNPIKILKSVCEIYPSEFFYHLRYYISNAFQIPIKCIQINKNEQTPNPQSNKNNSINILSDYINIYDILDKKKKKNEFDNFNVQKISNPFSDDAYDNLRKLIINDKNLNNYLKMLLKDKSIDFASDIFGLINDKIENNNIINNEGNNIINKLINNTNKINSDELLNELFNFDDTDLFYMNYTLNSIFNFLKNNNNNNKNSDLINKFIKSDLWNKKIKLLNIKINDLNDNRYSSLNELYESKKYENNLLIIYKLILSTNNLNLDENDLEKIISNIIIIIEDIIEDCIYMNLNLFKPQNDEEKKKINSVKKIYYDFFKNICDILKNNNKNLYFKFIEKLFTEKNKSEGIEQTIFEIIFIEGILKNNYPLYTELISEFLLSLIQNKNNESEKEISDFYINICNAFYTKESKKTLCRILSLLYNSSDIIKYENNLEIYMKNITKIFEIIYNKIFQKFDFDFYINEVVINSLFEPFLDEISADSNFHDYYFGGMCMIMFYYLEYTGEDKFRKVEYYKGKNLKEYLYDEIIMFNHSNEEASSPKTKTQSQSNYLKVEHSFNSVSHLFISLLIKDEIYSSNNEIQEGTNQLIPRKGIIFYLNELDNLHKMTKYNYIKGNQPSDWKLYFKDQNNSKTFIGLKNLGCTCYMNSLLQVFYNITLFRESLLKCKHQSETKNSLYETQKIFFNLKYLKQGFYTPTSFVNNYDDEKLNPGQQMDVDEFFSNLLDKLENRIKSSENENLIKYFFQGKLNDTLTFQEGCNHDRTKVTDFYSIQLQVINKKNIYESLDTLTEGELMNGDNCIFCPKCNKKFPALKSQSFNTLPRILMFVLKRFEFNYETMAKIKINDYYEFPLELDMSKYIKNDDNNKYLLKSVVVHMGHSEGGHYYAFIKEDKSKIWYQFNDTFVDRFNIDDLKKETFGGKEDNGEEKNRSAYLLFYEKVDQSKCEQFDKIKILNKLIKLNDDGIDGYNNIINNNDDPELIDMGGNLEDMKKIFKNINEQMRIEYLKQLVFSSNYHLFTLEFFLNVINIIDNKGKNLSVFLQNFSFVKFDHHFLGEEFNFRNFRPNISNIKRYIDKGKIKILNVEINNNTNGKNNDEEMKKKLLEIFKYILIIFFNIIIHSREKKYFGCYVELIKYLINQYDFCANYFLEEFGCHNTLIEYLVNCPMYNIKKILVGLIYYAMLKSEQSYSPEKKRQDMKDISSNENNNNTLSDEEIAKRLQEQFNQGYSGYSIRDEKGDENLLKNGISTPNCLRIVYNIAHFLKKIKFDKYQNESRFLFLTLLKFSLISQKNKMFLTKDINILLPLNILIAKNCNENKYSYEEVFDFDRGAFSSPHEILNPSPDETILGDSDKVGNYITLEYDLMLLCNLNYFKCRTKDEIKKNKYDIGFTFWKEGYLYNLLRYTKTKMAIKYFSKLIVLKCNDNKDLFDVIIKELFKFLDIITDAEDAYFDESDPEQNLNIYKNTEKNIKNCSLRVLKKNISFLLRILILESINDKFSEYKIKTILSKLFSFFSKNKKYYSRAITAINIILNIFESIELDSKKYYKDLNDILHWLNKFNIAPKHYEIKGINMYKDLPLSKHVKQMDIKQRTEYEKKEIEKTNKKIERLKSIIMNKKCAFNISNFEGDLSDFKFNFGDIVSYENKVYKVINCLDEMIEVKLIEDKKISNDNKDNKDNNNNEWDDIYRNKKLEKKKMNIYQKEKIKFWIETDDYRLRIKQLEN